MDALSIATNYLAPHGDSFWRWSEDLEALEWSDGTVIAFYDEVSAVIEFLGARSLPPFQCIVLLLAACQYNWLTPSRFQLLIDYAKRLDQEALRQRLPKDWKQRLREKLDRIHQLLREQQATTAFKRALAEQLFESSDARCDLDGPAPVLEQLAKGIPAPVLPASGDPNSITAQTDDFIASVRSLLSGICATDAASLQTRIETGLSQLPAAAELPDDPDLPDVARLRRLLTELASSGDELAGIARIAQNLMAAVHLPRAIAEPEQLPLGGFSDISNRGHLDRLLITELAHDDETLSVRIALNEALYLRRESPPKTPQRRRALLIDCGIRLWGVPRVFATAVGLALAATADKLAQVSAFRPAGDELEPADLLSRQGLVAHLAALDPNPHPAAAAINFIDLCDAGPDDVDPVLITHANVLTDPEFRRHLRDHLTDEALYIATVDGAGHYQLFAFSRAGQKRLQQARIDLDQLLDSPEIDRRPSGELLREDIDPDLPAIFSMRLCPLRTSYQCDLKRSLYHRRVGVIGHTKDGRLLRWESRRAGARIVSSEIPNGSVVWHHIDPERRIAHLLVNGYGYSLFSANLDTGISQTHLLEIPIFANRYRRDYCRHNQSLFIVIHGVAYMFSLHNGQACGSIDLPHPTRTRSGRFFRFGEEWQALSGDLVPHFEDVRTSQPTTHIFESDAVPAPVGLTTDGRLLLLDGDEEREIASLENYHPGGSITLSDDTYFVAVSSRDHTDIFCLGTGKRRLQTGPAEIDANLNPLKTAIARHGRRSIHINFRAIGCSARGHIILVTSRGAVHRIERHAPSGGIVLRHLPSPGGPGHFIRDFVDISAPGEARFKLQRADWPCGSRAYLDSRGFLHIAPNSGDCPEITFTLHDGLLSGWTSDGQFFGDSYYTDPGPISDAAAIFKQLEKITARILAFLELQ